jgi:hypothetical protein
MREADRTDVKYAVSAGSGIVDAMTVAGIPPNGWSRFR